MKRLPFLFVLSLFFSLPVSAAQNIAPGNRGMDGSPRLFERVVIDAGHGGRDPGAVGHEEALEKDLALQLAQTVAEGLRKRGLDIKMTRNSDRFVPLDNRSQLTNEWKPDLFISIHLNASESGSLAGFEVYTLSEETDDLVLARERSRRTGGSSTLDVILRDLKARENRRQAARLAELIRSHVTDRAPVEAERLRSANFRVLKGAECPAILVEAGYLTHLRDRSRLKNPRYRQRLAEGIIEAVWSFKVHYEATDGFARLG